MKKILAAFIALALVPAARSETAADLKRWTVEGTVQVDTAKLGPTKTPSFKFLPKSKAILKLRPTDGSGTVSFYVYDDGKVASPAQTKMVGPRWGLLAADGRVLVGAIMYHPNIPPEGAVCLFDTDSAQKDAWSTFTYLSSRGAPGWRKWEFDYGPKEGLRIYVDGKQVDQKHFDWNASKATGFDGIVIYGDDTTENAPQTFWVSDVRYVLGPPMIARPTSLPAATPTPSPVSATTPPPAKAPTPDGPATFSGPPVVAKMNGFVPGPTLLDDLKNLQIPVAADYGAHHPRLLFSVNDKAALQKKSQEQPELWKRVLADAKFVQPPGSVPDAALITSGDKYWRVEKVESAALAWFLTGDKAAEEGAVRWMVALCQQKLWGNVFRPNVDLPASWNLYHLAVAYDILKDDLSAENQALIRDSLAEHARAIYADLDPANAKGVTYDQNHTYIPTVALNAAALALLDDVPDARNWLTRGYAVLRRCRYVLPEDGYYYEGFGYWGYALHWHVRAAEMLQRATGEPLFNLPALHDTWKFGLQLNLPGTPRAFDVGDSNTYDSGKRSDILTTNATMMWEIAARTGSTESQLVGDLYDKERAETDYPASAFLWFDPAVKPASLAQIAPYQYFSDMDVVAWRSGWQDDATCYLFRCGPPLGHKAAAKMARLKDWTMNTGHVHADIGGFLMYAKGAYLAVGTGYTAQKWTRDHNTLLVDDKGQASDGEYHNANGVPYADLDQARIDQQFLSPAYGYASGEFGSAYQRQVPGVKLRRSVLMTGRWMLVVDDMAGSVDHKLTWICHSEAAFEPEGAAFVSHQPKASLAVVPVAPAGVEAKPDETTVAAGHAPGKGTPEKHGFQLWLSSPAAVKSTRFVNLLLPLDASEKPPKVEAVKNEPGAVSFRLAWATGRTEMVRLNLDWKNGAKDGPATMDAK